MKEENVTTVASNSKLLPLSKIVSARKFKKIEYLSDNFGALSLEDENISAATTGTLIDFLTRVIVLKDDDAFGESARGVSELANKEQTQRYLFNCATFKVLIDNKKIDDLEDDVFNLGLEICSWEQGIRSGLYVPPSIYPDEVTISHYKIMLNRAKVYLNKIGSIIRTSYASATENGLITGDGDYLAADTLIDFKVSKRATMAPNWVRQLFLYRVLLRDEIVSPDQIKKLMIFNPRRGEGFLLDLTTINPDILTFVKSQAEKRSQELMGSANELTKKAVNLVVNHTVSYEDANLSKHVFNFDSLGHISNEGESLTTEQIRQILLFLIDYCYINKQFSLNDANKGAGIANQIDDKAGTKLIEYEHTFKKIPVDKELPDKFFVYGCKISRYIIAYEKGKWVDINANDTDIKHLKVIFNRIQKFFEEKGIPTELRVNGYSYVGKDWNNLKEETYNIDLKKDTTAWIVGLMTDDNLDILQVKNLKSAKDGEFTEVGIFNPRLNTYYFKTRPKRDYEL